MNVAYHPYYEELLNNGAFNPDHPYNWNEAHDRWIALKEFLAEKGIELNTYDIYDDFRDIDLWIMQDTTWGQFKFLLRNRVNPKKVIIMLTEPRIARPWEWKYLSFYSWMFRSILTWNTELCRKGKKFYHYHFPQKFDATKYPYYKSKEKKNLCLMMHSHRDIRVKGELYSFRRSIVDYFLERGDGLLDLYGRYWDELPEYRPVYKGITPDKRETYSEYYFSLCIDNSIVPGYITYDPLISMSTGTVPVYLPMPDSTEYIPADTFIDLNRFNDLDEMVSCLQSIAGTAEYEGYRERGWRFINSEGYRPFTIERFCEDVYKAIRGSNNRGNQANEKFFR